MRVTHEPIARVLLSVLIPREHRKETMSNTSIEQLNDSVRSLRDELEMLAEVWANPTDSLADEVAEGDETWVTFAKWADDNGIDTDDSSDTTEMIETHLSESILEAYETGRRDVSRGEWESDGLVVVFSTGGPHIEVKDGRVHGYWSSDRTSLSLSNAASEMLEQILGIES